MSKKKDPHRNLKMDLGEAMLMISDYFTFMPDEEHFDMKFEREMPVSKILSMTDYSSWGEIEQGELVGMDSDELMGTLDSYRPGLGAKYLKDYAVNGYPAVILVDTPTVDELADGRGRVSCAVGMADKTMPAVILTVKAAYLEQYSSQLSEQAPLKLRAMIHNFLTESKAK